LVREALGEAVHSYIPIGTSGRQTSPELLAAAGD